MSADYTPTDLENQGIAGPNKLRELLTTCEDPIDAIKSFQQSNSIQLPTLNPALKLLDLHGVRRFEYHEIVLNEVTERLLIRLRSLGEANDKKSQKLLEQQLEKSFALYRVPQIRPVVLEALKQLPKVPDRYLKVILADPEFYKSCSVKVRQQIWLKNDALFVAAVEPLLDAYVSKKEKMLRNVDCGGMATFFVSETTKARRQWTEIQQLISIVGERESLYDRLLQVMRERFIQSRNVHYCSLRLELIMAAHDLNTDALVKLDPCHDFAWCLDACVRDKHLDAQQAQKLKTILDSNRKGAEQIWGDLSMIAADPHVVHFISSLAVKVLKDSAMNGHLPRDLLQMQLLLRLLSLGATTWAILKEEQVGEPAVDSIILTKFLADFMLLSVEDVCRLELQRAPDEVLDEYSASDFLSGATEALQNFVKSDLCCAWIWLHYSLDMFPGKKRVGDRAGLLRYLSLFANCKDRIGYSDPWLHLTVSKLIQGNPLDSLLANEMTAAALLDDFLLKGIDAQPGVKFHILRLINFLHHSIGETKSRSILELLRPDVLFPDLNDEQRPAFDEYTAVYAKVVQKIEVGRSPDAKIDAT